MAFLARFLIASSVQEDLWDEVSVHDLLRCFDWSGEAADLTVHRASSPSNFQIHNSLDSVDTDLGTIEMPQPPECATADSAAAEADGCTISLEDVCPRHSLYGIPLEVAAARSDPEGLVPSPVRKCIAYLIDNQLLGTEGLTRSTGSKVQISKFIEAFNSDYHFDFPPGVDGLTIASVLLAFLMQLKNADGETLAPALGILICMCCA